MEGVSTGTHPLLPETGQGAPGALGLRSTSLLKLLWEAVREQEPSREEGQEGQGALTPQPSPRARPQPRGSGIEPPPAARLRGLGEEGRRLGLTF